MLCDICKQNEATIHIKEIHPGGKIVSVNLCEECAKKKEKSGILGAFGFNLSDVLFNAAGAAAAAAKADDGSSCTDLSPEEQNRCCQACGWKAKDLCDTGRLGCPECYTAFSQLVEGAIKRVQRGQVHTGKRPAGNPGGEAQLRSELMQLKRELERLIQREEYESAALYRDRINALKSRLEATSGGDA